MENQITPPAAAQSSALDAHGFDLNDYNWVPVLRKRRVDGWSPDKQRTFIEVLADSGSVAQAARQIGMSQTSCYALRRSPGAEGFDRAWTAAIEAASKKLIDAAFERALVGSDEPVFNKDGQRIGRRFRQSDKMLQFLLRAYMPERFRHAAQDRIPATEPPAPALAPVAEALERLLPEPPAEPHTLMDPDDLESALMVADLCDGELPSWLRDPASVPHLNSKMPLGQDFERRLENAKREGSGQPPMTDEEWKDLLADLSRPIDDDKEYNPYR